MAKDKEHKKEKKEKKIKSTELAGNASTDAILSGIPEDSRDSMAIDEEDLYESRLAAQAGFAKPLANKKLNKKVLKAVKKGIIMAIPS